MDFVLNKFIYYLICVFISRNRTANNLIAVQMSGEIGIYFSLINLETPGTSIDHMNSEVTKKIFSFEIKSNPKNMIFYLLNQNKK